LSTPSYYKEVLYGRRSLAIKGTVHTARYVPVGLVLIIRGLVLIIREPGKPKEACRRKSYLLSDLTICCNDML
jgi:hypothetical protein